MTPDAARELWTDLQNDLTYRFPLIVETVARLRSRSCIINGEAVACDENGVPSFDRIRYRRHDASVFLYAFDLIELDGDDLRREPLKTRKATLASVLRRAVPGVRMNEHIEADGPTVFAQPSLLRSRLGGRKRPVDQGKIAEITANIHEIERRTSWL
jgi:bifunctional non-homologous end joining protein LigD